jgi:fatty-acid desaturase
MFKNFSTKNISLYSYFSFIPFVVAVPVIIYLFITGIIPTSYLWATFIGWILISGLGIATGYHRIFCHMPTLKKIFILLFTDFGIHFLAGR